MSRWMMAVCVGIGFALAATAEPDPLQTFTAKDYLGHAWSNELIHFPLSYRATKTPESLTLTDASGLPLPCQASALGCDGTTVTGTVWTVVSMPPHGTVTIALRPGSGGWAPSSAAGSSTLKVEKDDRYVVLGNAFMALRLPMWPGVLPQPLALTELPAPLTAVQGKGGPWLGAGTWFTEGAGLTVTEATTTVTESGPVRIIVRQKLVFADGRTYSASVELAAGQEVATIREESDGEAVHAGWRFSFQPGLGANQVFWNNQWSKEVPRRWAMLDTPAAFDKTNVVATLRPWTFWWTEGGTMWAGFYNREAGRQAANPFVGVLMLNPSRWLPGGAGFEHTAIPIVAGPPGRLDITLSFLTPAGKKTGALLRREWGLTVGTTAEHVLDPKLAMPLVGKPGGTPKLRYQLIKHGEFPLDEVKDYGFDFASTNAGRKHPFLILTPADVARSRRQAQTVSATRAQVAQSLHYIATCGGADRTLANEGPDVFYRRHYWGNGLTDMLPEAYLGSDDPLYGRMLAAAVQGLSKDIYDHFIEHPTRPALSAYGPWVAADFTRLLFAYDLVAGSGLLSAEDDLRAYRALVFGAQFLAHPDFWNVAHGLASGNPNMTNMIRLPLGLLGLFLTGHRRAEEWAAGAEAELREELADWITPGGAFIECPGYQGASLDGLLLLATAIRNVHGRDYFTDPQFQATMDYLGTLLTPPDRRFPPPGLPPAFNPTQTVSNTPPPALLPPFGDTPLGTVTPFSGWMAAGTSVSDPVFSRQQQFFWQLQNHQFAGGNRGNGFTVALTDPELPATPPTVLARRFPGFGNILRTSWTDARASYVAHRTGPNSHHYHDDVNSFIYYAKGAPLCLDFGNQYSPLRRDEPWWHNRVTFSTSNSTTKWGSTGETLELQTLPGFIDYSVGKSTGGGNQEAHRHLLLIKSADPLGANYVVVRDRTVDGQPGQQFSWNLFCLAHAPQIEGNIVHFPGQFDVDLDLHVLAPAAPAIAVDQWQWEREVGHWKTIGEELHGVRIAKAGSAEDYLTVLYPRSAGQPAAHVTTLAGGAALQATHMEGTDVVLLSPGKPTTVTAGAVTLQGETAFARKNTDGTVRLALVKGEGSVAGDAWKLEGTGPVALEVKGEAALGRSDGSSRNVIVTVPAGYDTARVSVDGKPVQAPREGSRLTVSLPAGPREFTIDGR